MPAAGVAEEAKGGAGVVAAVPVPESMNNGDGDVFGRLVSTQALVAWSNAMMAMESSNQIRALGWVGLVMVVSRCGAGVWWRVAKVWGAPGWVVMRSEGPVAVGRDASRDVVECNGVFRTNGAVLLVRQRW